MPEIALDRSALTMQYQTRAPTGALQLRVVHYPQWIRVLSENGNINHPVSANFSGLDLYWPNPMELNPPEGVEAIPLFTTTDEGWSMREPFFTNPEIPFLMERDAFQTWGRKILGASLSGVFPSWIVENLQLSPDDPLLLDIPQVSRPTRMIVVGNTDFASWFIANTNGLHNLDFLIQAADWLRFDDDVIRIRSRVSRTDRLDRIIDPVRQITAMRLSQLINVILVPVLVVFAGVFLALRRSSKSRARTEIDADSVKEQ